MTDWRLYQGGDMGVAKEFSDSMPDNERYTAAFSVMIWWMCEVRGDGVG